MKGDLYMGKKPRWEIKYEKYKAEEPKYKDMEKNIAETEALITTLETGKVKVKGDFKTKEAYQEALETKKSEIQKEIKTKKEEVDLMRKELEKYENYKKNKDKIKNILEYRNALQARLEKLPKDLSKEIENKQKDTLAIAEGIKQYSNEIEELRKQAKNDMPEDQKRILLFTLKTKIEARESLRNKKYELNYQIRNLEGQQKSYNSDVEDKKIIYERRISKCNIIAANLLKGKNIGEFELKVEPASKKFTSPDGKIAQQINATKNALQNKTQATSQPTQYSNLNQQKMSPNGLTKVGELDEFKEKHPTMAKIRDFFKRIKDKIKRSIAMRKLNELNKKNGYIRPLTERSKKRHINNENGYNKPSKLNEMSAKKAAEKSGFNKMSAKAEEIKQQLLVKEKEEEENRIKDEENRIEDEENNLLYEVTEKGAEKTFKERLSIINKAKGYNRPTTEQTKKFHTVDQTAKPHREYKDNEGR